jgi:stage II sporulation protein D
MRSQRYLPAVIIAALVLGGVFLYLLTRGAGDKGPAYKKEPEISVYFHEDQTTKKMPLEEYLMGVVAGEMRGDWPEKAYAAQAIVARTFTLELIGRGGTKEFHQTDICTDEKHAQAYNAGAVTPAIRRAVEMTRGEVMTYGGNYTKGWFSASCGGRTAPAQVALGFTGEEPAYITSVNCPEESVIPEEELYWSARFSRAELDAILKTLGKSVGQVRRLEIGEKHEDSHRVTRLDFIGTAGRAGVRGADFRKAAGPEKVRSTWITGIQQEGEAIILEGRGFGHGVGLCQWGANALAAQGKDPHAIVKHYYPEVEIKKLWK